MTERPSTPPRTTTTTATGPNAPPTPEQMRQVELNRLRAKAAQREREAEANTSNAVNGNNKRMMSAPAVKAPPPAISSSAVASSSRSKPLKRDSRLGTYFEYDLSKMVNSKGGFLVEDKREIDEDQRRKEQERERQRALQAVEPTIYLDPAKNPKCRECGTVDVDQTFKQVFGVLVCRKCQNEKPELYSLLTKTECKEDYLLTDPELRDHEVLPHLLKANPHSSTYSNMMLYVRFQVEEFAWKKWGSPEALDKEYERRVEEKKKKKNKKFEESLRELRKRTKEGVWQRRKDAEHKHSYGPLEQTPEGTTVETCTECGFSVEVEIL